MARISKADHAKILQLVNVDGIKVAEVAKTYGCTPANIYALLAKLRQSKAPMDNAIPSTEDHAPQNGTSDGPAPRAAGTALPGLSLPITDLLSAMHPAAEVEKHAPDVPPVHPGTTAAATASSPSDQSVSIPGGAGAVLESASAAPSIRAQADAISKRESAPASEGPGKTFSRGRGIGGALAKPGFGLMMRTEDGDENMTPFRSLDDLLSAVKPILRTAARSTDPVWFSIQSVDLSTLDSDAS